MAVWLSIFLSVLIFVQSSVLAYAPETNFWKERGRQHEQLASLPSASNRAHIFKQMPSVASQAVSSSVSTRIAKALPKGIKSEIGPLLASLSSDFGNVRKIQLPSSSQKARRIVVHIQDVHLNPEAQANIGKAVQALVEKKQIGLVGLEGSFVPVDLSDLRAFDDKDATDMVAEYLLRENRISGAVHALFTSRSEIPAITGVDDPALYHANVEAYRSSKDRAVALKKKLDSFENDLIKRFAELNPALAAFHEQVSRYRDGFLPMGPYVETLAKFNLHSSPEIDVFLEAFHLESTLDFAKVEAERTMLLEQLLAKLNTSQTNDLLDASLAYRLGNLNHTDFYQYLKDLCSRNNLSLSQYKTMGSYIHYVLLTDAINPNKLLPEIAKLEKDVYVSLTKLETEKAIVEEAKRLHLAGKLVDFALTPDEWDEYKTFKSSFGDDSLRPFERFYEMAAARNHAITANVLDAMDRNRASVAVLVTGGFHSPGIDALMKKAGVATVTFVPRITKVESESGSAYLSVFAREKTPLDQLFAGEKLFVSMDHTAGLVNRPFVSGVQKAAKEHIRTNKSEVSIVGSAVKAVVKFTGDHKIEAILVSATLGLGSLFHAIWPHVSSIGLSGEAVLFLLLTGAFFVSFMWLPHQSKRLIQIISLLVLSVALVRGDVDAATTNASRGVVFFERATPEQQIEALGDYLREEMGRFRSGWNFSLRSFAMTQLALTKGGDASIPRLTLDVHGVEFKVPGETNRTVRLFPSNGINYQGHYRADPLAVAQAGPNALEGIMLPLEQANLKYGRLPYDSSEYRDAVTMAINLMAALAPNGGARQLGSTNNPVSTMDTVLVYEALRQLHVEASRSGYATASTIRDIPETLLKLERYIVSAYDQQEGIFNFGGTYDAAGVFHFSPTFSSLVQMEIIRVFGVAFIDSSLGEGTALKVWTVSKEKAGQYTANRLLTGFSVSTQINNSANAEATLMSLYAATELATHYSIHRETIGKDISSLRQLGLPQFPIVRGIMAHGYRENTRPETGLMGGPLSVTWNPEATARGYEEFLSRGVGISNRPAPSGPFQLPLTNITPQAGPGFFRLSTDLNIVDDVPFRFGGPTAISGPRRDLAISEVVSRRIRYSEAIRIVIYPLESTPISYLQLNITRRDGSSESLYFERKNGALVSVDREGNLVSEPTIDIWVVPTGIAITLPPSRLGPDLSRLELQTLKSSQERGVSIMAYMYLLKTALPVDSDSPPANQPTNSVVPSLRRNGGASLVPSLQRRPLDDEKVVNNRLAILGTEEKAVSHDATSRNVLKRTSRWVIIVLLAVFMPIAVQFAALAQQAGTATDSYLPKAPEAITRAATSEVEEQRFQAIKLLSDFGPMAKDAVPQLIVALDDSSPRVRLEALRALEAIGQWANQAVPHLILKLKDQNKEIRIRSAAALGKIGGDAKEALAPLGQILINDKDSGVRAEAVKAISEIGVSIDAKAQIPLLIQALKDADVTVRQQAALALGVIQPLAVQAVADLQQALQDKDEMVREAAQRSLSSIQRKASFTGKDKAIQLWVDALASRDYFKQSRAQEKLVRVGDAAIPFLMDQLKSEDFDIYNPAKDTLRKIESPSVINALIEGAKSRNGTLRLNSIRTLSEIKPVRQNAADAIIRAMDDELPNVRSAALWGIPRGGPLAAQFVKPLIKRLSDQKGIRGTAAYTLGELGALSKEALPQLKALENDSNINDSSSAKVALAKIEKALAKNEPTKDIPGLIAQLEGSVPYEQKRQAEEELIFLGEKAVPQLMAAFLNPKQIGGNLGVRTALEKIKSPDIFPLLSEAFGKVQGYSQTQIIYLMATTGDERAKAFLMKIVESEKADQYAYDPRNDALSALDRFDGSDVEAFFQKFANSSDRFKRQAAIQGLGKILFPAPETFSILVHALEDEYTEVRRGAVESLDRMGDEAAVPALQKALARETDPYIRENIGKALERLKSGAKSGAQIFENEKRANDQKTQAAQNVLKRTPRWARAAVLSAVALFASLPSVMRAADVSGTATASSVTEEAAKAVVQTPFWEQTWFLVLGGAVVLGLVIAVMVRALKPKNPRSIGWLSVLDTPRELVGLGWGRLMAVSQEDLPKMPSFYLPILKGLTVDQIGAGLRGLLNDSPNEHEVVVILQNGRSSERVVVRKISMETDIRQVIRALNEGASFRFSMIQDAKNPNLLVIEPTETPSALLMRSRFRWSAGLGAIALLASTGMASAQTNAGSTDKAFQVFDHVFDAIPVSPVLGGGVIMVLMIGFGILIVRKWTHPDLKKELVEHPTIRKVLAPIVEGNMFGIVVYGSSVGVSLLVSAMSPPSLIAIMLIVFLAAQYFFYERPAGSKISIYSIARLFANSPIAIGLAAFIFFDSPLFLLIGIYSSILIVVFYNLVVENARRWPLALLAAMAVLAQSSALATPDVEDLQRGQTNIVRTLKEFRILYPYADPAVSPISSLSAIDPVAADKLAQALDLGFKTYKATLPKAEQASAKIPAWFVIKTSYASGLPHVGGYGIGANAPLIPTGDTNFVSKIAAQFTYLLQSPVNAAFETEIEPVPNRPTSFGTRVPEGQVVPLSSKEIIVTVIAAQTPRPRAGVHIELAPVDPDGMPAPGFLADNLQWTKTGDRTFVAKITPHHFESQKAPSLGPVRAAAFHFWGTADAPAPSKVSIRVQDAPTAEKSSDSPAKPDTSAPGAEGKPTGSTNDPAALTPPLPSRRSQPRAGRTGTGRGKGTDEVTSAGIAASARATARKIAGKATAADAAALIPIGRITDYSGKVGLQSFNEAQLEEFWSLVRKELKELGYSVEEGRSLDDLFQIGDGLVAVDTHVKEMPYHIIAPDFSTDEAGFNQKLADAQRMIRQGFSRVRIEINQGDRSRIPSDLANHVMTRGASLTQADISDLHRFVQHARRVQSFYGTAVLAVDDALFAGVSERALVDGNIIIVRYSDLLKGSPRIAPLSVVITLLQIAGTQT